MNRNEDLYSEIDSDLESELIQSDTLPIEINSRINKKLAKELDIKLYQVERAVELLDQSNTIPFIARYRKEMTGSLTDVKLRELNEKLEYLRGLESRKLDIIRLLSISNKLTDELLLSIKNAENKTELEDIYRPYKQKKRTKATIAKENGLEELAKIILEKSDINFIKEEAFRFLNENVSNIEEAIIGAKDIICEMFSDRADFRLFIRKYFEENGVLTSKVIQGKDENKLYEIYYDFSSILSKLNSHRILAINRAEKDGILKINLNIDFNNLKDLLIKKFDINLVNSYISEALDESLKKYIIPSIEREIRNTLTENAHEQAISVFGTNLRQKLIQPPFKNKVVLGFDPAYRTGCKLSVINEMGKLEAYDTIYPTKPQEKIEESKEVIKNLINKYNVDLISIGNGTASRESERFIADTLKEVDKKVEYVIVDEAGASVYSASKLGNEEYPDIDVSIRGAISIAKRLQDPLSELVKIDPKSIGVGQYQHDVNQKRLSEVLDNIVIDTVNAVGVDVNTASEILLSYISGISKKSAKNIVEKRFELGGFKNREQIKEVKGIGKVSYQQAIGFLRVLDGDNKFDITGVHPEDYELFEKIVNRLDINKEDIGKKNINAYEKANKIGMLKLAKEFNTHIIKVEDIVKEIDKPARDPREDVPSPILRKDVVNFEDLKLGMKLNGTIKNIVDFGAFVDMGVKYDGLIHISKISNKFIKHPLDILKVGDVVEATIIDIDINKKKINLSLID